MNDVSLLKSDVFFIITTLAVVFVTVILLIGLGYIVQILASIRRIMRQAELATEHVAEDIEDLRKDIKRDGFSFRPFLDFFAALMGKTHPRAKRK